MTELINIVLYLSLIFSNFLFSFRLAVGGAVAEWVTCWTGDRVVLGSNPAEAIYFASELWQFRRSLLSGVYARASKRSHQSALEMCNLSWIPHCSLEKDNSLNHSWATLEISLATSVCYPVSMMCSKSKNNILYLYTLSRKEILFKGVYSGTLVIQTKNIINDDKR